MSKKFKSLGLKFQVGNSPIDYFKIPVQSLKDDGIEIRHREISLDEDEYLTVDHLEGFNYYKNETVVFNVQVGKGKTTLCYDLVQHYVNKGFKVIVASPFTKLVDKDYSKLLERKLSAFHYKNLPEDTSVSLDDILSCDVQVMTINCLLRNPGEDAYFQKFEKRNYLDALFKHYTEKNSRVIIFFDEIHESIHNFKSANIPHLVKWDSLVSKCFIASATYTPASIPVIKYISCLTQNAVNVYEVARAKTKDTSNLHVHLIDENYSASNIEPLESIADIINANKGKKVNILTGYRSIARSLINKDSKDEFVKSVINLNPNLTDGSADKPFDISSNNIGTTFKTGIDVNDPGSVFIIILPTITEEANYGIFSDGLPSIVQAVARLRVKGELHVFCRMPPVIMDENSNVLYNSYEFLSIPKIGHKSQNELLSVLIQTYSKSKAEVIDHIKKLEDISSKVTLRYHYRTPEEYLMGETRNLLVKQHYEYGKTLTPYLLWAALNNQFTSTTLKSIFLVRRNFNYINIDGASGNTLAGNISNLIGQKHLYDFLVEASSYLSTLKTTKFILSGSTLNYIQLKNNFDFFNNLIQLYFSHHSINYNLQKEDYILGNCLVLNNHLFDTGSRRGCFYVLEKLRQNFINYMANEIIVNAKNEAIIHRDVWQKLPISFYDSVEALVPLLKKVDILISSKYFPFLEGLHKKTVLVRRQSIYKMFEKCFTNVSDVKKTHLKGKDKFYLVQGNLERQLPDELKNVKF